MGFGPAHHEHPLRVQRPGYTKDALGNVGLRLGVLGDYLGVPVVLAFMEIAVEDTVEVGFEFASDTVNLFPIVSPALPGPPLWLRRLVRPAIVKPHPLVGA